METTKFIDLVACYSLDCWYVCVISLCIIFINWSNKLTQYSVSPSMAIGKLSNWPKSQSDVDFRQNGAIFQLRRLNYERFCVDSIVRVRQISLGHNIIKHILRC